MNTQAALSADELNALRFIAHARLGLALGVTLACASRASQNSWAAVTHALVALARALGWNVRALAVVVGPEQASRHVENALDSTARLVAHREHEPELMKRAAAIRVAIAAVNEALERARSPSQRSAA
jgi:hypothetical protein